MHAHVHLQYFSYQKTCLNIFKFLLHILLLKKEALCNQKLGKKIFSFRPFLFSTNTNWPEQQIASLSARKSQHKRVISQIGAKFLHRKFEAVSDSQVFDCSWIVPMCKSCESVMADAGWPSFLLEIRRPPNTCCWSPLLLLWSTGDHLFLFNYLSSDYTKDFLTSRYRSIADAHA